MQKYLEIGLSGWIIFIVTALLGGGIFVHQIIRRRIRQSNITAGGDVAGGNIIKGEHKVKNSKVSVKKVSHIIQENIVAKGDVAGGDIFKSDE
jgi:hypothetical protein